MKFLLILTLLLAACSTTRTPIDAAIPIHWDNAIAYQEQTSQRNAIVKVIRDEGFAGSGCSWTIAINKKKAAHLDTNEQATFYVEPGGLLVEVRSNPESGSLCGRSSWRSHHTTIQKGETKYFRVGFELNNAVFIPVIGFFVKHREMYIEPYDKPIDWGADKMLDDSDPEEGF